MSHLWVWSFFFPKYFQYKKVKWTRAHKNEYHQLTEYRKKQLTLCTWHNRFTDIANSIRKCKSFHGIGMCVYTAYQLAFNISSVSVGQTQKRIQFENIRLMKRGAHKIVNFIIHHMESHILNGVLWLRDPWFLGTQTSKNQKLATKERPNSFQMCAWYLNSVCTLCTAPWWNKIKIKTQTHEVAHMKLTLMTFMTMRLNCSHCRLKKKKCWKCWETFSQKWLKEKCWHTELWTLYSATSQNWLSKQFQKNSTHQAANYKPIKIVKVETIWFEFSVLTSILVTY